MSDANSSYCSRDTRREYRRRRKARSAAVEQDLERSIEDFVEGIVDDITTKFTCKSAQWECGQAAESGESDAVKDNDEAQRRRTRRDHHRARAKARRGSFRSRIGSGRGLYRDVRHKKILGVCAGLAEYLQVERWKVRLVAVLALIFMSSAALITYFLAYFLMDKKPYYREVTDRYDADELYDDDLDEGMVDENVTASRSRYTRGLSRAEALRLMKQKFQDIEERLRAMESHVTSSRFELQREFRNLGDDEQSSSVS